MNRMINIPYIHTEQYIVVIWIKKDYPYNMDSQKLYNNCDIGDVVKISKIQRISLTNKILSTTFKLPE